MDIKLSYILTTYNKLSYLKITLPYLIEACNIDEEIVIVDGGSEDGTKEYVLDLFNQKKIHQFISEKDAGEAHGTNKAILLAKGELLKIITDDDIFDFTVIKFCKNHLLKNEEIDICGSDGLGISATYNNKFLITNYCEGYKEWKNNKSPFLFCGLSYLIRKSSITKLGLLSTQFRIIDIEYSIRVSAMKANIVFCNAYSFVNIVGSDSNSHKFYDCIKNEKKLLKKIYPAISNLNLATNFSIAVKEKIKKITNGRPTSINNVHATHSNYITLVENSVSELTQKNKSIVISFL